MSKADRIYDIAEKLGYEGDTEGSTSDAINAVSDALGFVGPHEKRITSALTDLYTVVGGGGGGGDLGALQTWPAITWTEPTVGAEWSGSSFDAYSVAVDGSTVIETEENTALYGVATIAAGFTLRGKYSGRDVSGPLFDGYVVSFNESFEYASVTPWSGTVSATEDSGTYTVSFEVPELADGSVLVIYNHDDGVSIEV